MSMDEAVVEENKRERRVNKFVTDDGVVTVQVSDGAGGWNTVVELDVAELSEDIRDKALQHGLLSKLGDAGAIKADEDISVAEEKILRVAEQLKAGEWNTRRQGDNVKASKKDISAKLADMTPEQRDAAAALLAKLGLAI